MAVSPAKRASNAKWDRENMTTLGCRVKRDDAERYHAAAAAQGTTVNAVMRKALDEMLSITEQKESRPD